MFDKLFGGIVQGAGDLLGAFEAQEIAEDNRTLQREHALRQEQLQREFAQHGIQWRVEDAKAAGLHPVFALTGGGAAYSPSSVVGDVPEARFGKALSNMGQNITRAALAEQTEQQREEHKMRMALMQAQIDEMDARTFGLYSAQATTQQGNLASAGFPEIQTQPFVRGSVEQRHLDDVIAPKPDEVVSRRSENQSLTSGEHAAWREYQITQDGTKVQLPYSEEGPGEALENIPWYMWPAVIQHNRSYYGPDWGTRLLRELFGNRPKYRKHGTPHGRFFEFDRGEFDGGEYAVPSRR